MNPDLTLLGSVLVGLLGSVHCIGMCGGIVGALSGASRAGGLSGRAPWSLLFAYNAGRIASYAMAGVLAGWLGSRALSVFVPERVAAVGLTLSGLFCLPLGFISRVGGRAWRS